jgi:hypothetical protein
MYHRQEPDNCQTLTLAGLISADHPKRMNILLTNLKPQARLRHGAAMPHWHDARVYYDYICIKRSLACVDGRTTDVHF